MAVKKRKKCPASILGRARDLPRRPTYSGGVPCTFFGNRLLICAKPKPWSSASALRNRKEDKKTCTTLLTLFQLLPPTMNYFPLMSPLLVCFTKLDAAFPPSKTPLFFFPHTKEMRRVFQTRRCILRERKNTSSHSRGVRREKRGSHP